MGAIETGVEPPVEPYLQDDPGSLHRCKRSIDRCKVERDRLLAEDLLSRLGRLLDEFRVRIRARADDYRLDLRVIEDSPVVFERLGDAKVSCTALGSLLN